MYSNLAKIQCGCQKIGEVFIVLGVYNFGSPLTVREIKILYLLANTRRIMVQGSMVELAIKVELTYIFPQELFFYSMNKFLCLA